MSSENSLRIQSDTIDWLRFPLSVLVVFIHFNPTVDIQTVDFQNLKWRDSYDIIGTLISDVLGKIAVPCFYMFSGYLFFYKLREWNSIVYFSKVKTRLRTLILPYFLFNLTALVLTALMMLRSDGNFINFLNEIRENWFRIFWNYTSWGDNNTNILGEPLPSYGPYVLPLWFLRDLIVMVFISPVVYYFVKLTKLWGLTILFFFYYTKIWIDIPGYSSLLFLTALFFFSFGAFFSINKLNLVISLRKYQGISITVALLSMALSTYFSETPIEAYFLPIFIFSGVITVVSITSHFIESGIFRVSGILSRSSFFIYCTHTILILAYTKIGFQFLVSRVFVPESTIELWAIYLFVPLVTSGIIICIFLFMNRFLPTILKLYTGNR